MFSLNCYPSHVKAVVLLTSLLSVSAFAQTQTPPDPTATTQETPQGAIPPAPPESAPTWQESAKEKIQQYHQAHKDSKAEKPKEEQFGNYSLYMEPVEFDVRARWKNNRPDLRFRGTFLDSRFAKKVPLEGDGDWVRTQGLRGRLRGELRTASGQYFDVQAQAFTTWEGVHKSLFTFGSPIETKYEISAGPTHDFEERRTEMALNAYQEWQGSLFNINLFGKRDLEWLVEATETYAKRIAGRRLEDEPKHGFRYDILFGIKQEVHYTLWNYPLKFKLIYGPVLRGDDESMAKISAKFRLRLEI